MDRAACWNRNLVYQNARRDGAIMHSRLGAMVVCTCMAITGCAEYSKPQTTRTLAHKPAPIAEYKKPQPVTTQSIAPLAAPTPAIDRTPALNSTPPLEPIPALDPTPAFEASLEDQLKAAWKHICGLRNVEHVEKGRVNETEAQKHFIDEKCADVRRDSHIQ
jgi:hypothetical protein